VVTAHFKEKGGCVLRLIDIDGDGAEFEKDYDCGSDVPIDISATENCCLTFSH
jgi:hypothetical protein